MWLDALPAELVATDASLSAARVLLALDTGRLEEVIAAFDAAEASSPADTRQGGVGSGPDAQRIAFHLRAIYRKLGAESREDAVIRAREGGLI